MADGFLLRREDHRQKDLYIQLLDYTGLPEQREEKIVCRYPQFYAAGKLFRNIREHRKPEGDGKGGFTGTPIDATFDVFGEVVDSYTMTESVKDEITVPIVYEGRAAKVNLDNEKLQDIEAYYEQCAEDGASDYQIEESKKASSNMSVILGDSDRIRALAQGFVQHYMTR